MGFESIEQKVTQVNSDIKTFKAGLAEKLNEKGVPTSAKDSTVQMIENIGKIEGGGSGGELVSGTKIPSDMLNPPAPNRTFDNFNNSDWNTRASFWIDEIESFAIYGEQYGENISIIDLDGNVQRIDIGGAKHVDYLDGEFIIGYDNKEIRRMSLEGVEETIVNLTEYFENLESYNPILVDIRLINDKYYMLFSGVPSYGENDSNYYYIFRMDKDGENVLGGRVDDIDDPDFYLGFTVINYFDDKIFLRGMRALYVFDLDLELIKRIESYSDGDYWTKIDCASKMYQVGDVLIFNNGSNWKMVDLETLEVNENSTLNDFYYFKCATQLSEYRFIGCSNGVFRVIDISSIDFETGCEYVCNDYETFEMVSLNVMKDGNYLCEIGEKEMIKINSDFSTEWRVGTYGTQNYNNYSENHNAKMEICHEKGDYIYFVRRGAVLELDFVPAYTIK